MSKNLDVIADNYSRNVFKFGRADVTTTAVIWDGTGAYTGWLAAEAACEVLSGSANDKTGGGGATELTVVGQGDDGLEISETVDLNGVNAVDLVNKYKIIYRAYCPDSEESNPLAGANHGLITIRKKAGPVIMAKILATLGQTYMCVYRIPSNYYGELISTYFFTNVGKGAIIQLKKRRNLTDERGWRGMMSYDLFENDGGHNLKDAPQFLYPGEDVCAIATSTAAGTSVSGHFIIRLRPIADGLFI